MKRLSVIALFIVGSSVFTVSNAQTFQFGSLVVSATYGLDVYSVKQHDVNTFSNQHKDTTSGAGCGALTILGEFGVTNWLGLGLNFKFDSYLHKSDITQANGFETGIAVNAHFLRKFHLDMFGGMDIGYSSLTVTANDGYNDQIYGSGLWYDFHGTTRVYFGKFGFSATMYLPFINYANLTSNNSTFNRYILAAWKANGFGINFGFQYRILQ